MTIHPCGALPVRSFMLNVWHCEHHQAFFARCHTFTETGSDELTEHQHAEIEWGPFDTLPDLHAWIRAQWDAWPPVATLRVNGLG